MEQVSAVKLGYQLQVALKDCIELYRHSPYIWKQASMRKLHALGLVEPDQLMYCGKLAYHPTAAGIAAVSASEGTP
jgi:hypothetical protein